MYNVNYDYCLEEIYRGIKDVANSLSLLHISIHSLHTDSPLVSSSYDTLCSALSFWLHQLSKLDEKMDQDIKI